MNLHDVFVHMLVYNKHLKTFVAYSTCSCSKILPYTNTWPGS